MTADPTAPAPAPAPGPAPAPAQAQAPAPTAEPLGAAIGQAERRYDLVEQTIAKHDSKAAFVVGGAGATLAVAASLVAQRPLHAPGTAVLAAGMLALLAGVVMAGMVVTPHSGDRWAVEGGTDTLWHGELRRYRPADLAARLAGQSDEDRLREVCHGTVTIARIAWHKAGWLRRAMLATLTGIVLLAAAWPVDLIARSPR